MYSFTPALFEKVLLEHVGLDDRDEIPYDSECRMVQFLIDGMLVYSTWMAPEKEETPAYSTLWKKGKRVSSLVT